jgi:hypothetical protein
MPAATGTPPPFEFTPVKKPDLQTGSKWSTVRSAVAAGGIPPLSAGSPTGTRPPASRRSSTSRTNASAFPFGETVLPHSESGTFYPVSSLSTVTPAVLGVVQGTQAVGRPVQSKRRKEWQSTVLGVGFVVCVGLAAGVTFTTVNGIVEYKKAEEDRHNGKHTSGGGGGIVIAIVLFVILLVLALGLIGLWAKTR